MEEAYRPHALRVMAEYMSDDPVWDSNLDHTGPVVLQDLGVSTQLVQRLQAWNEHFNGIALTDFEFASEDILALTTEALPTSTNSPCESLRPSVASRAAAAETLLQLRRITHSNGASNPSTPPTS
jgi:hypothetical protein